MLVVVIHLTTNKIENNNVISSNQFNKSFFHKTKIKANNEPLRC